MGEAASEGDAVPGLGLPIVTAAEPACAGTPEQGLPMGVYSPMSPAWALPSQASLPSYGKPAMGASDASAATWSRRALGRPASPPSEWVSCSRWSSAASPRRGANRSLASPRIAVLKSARTQPKRGRIHEQAACVDGGDRLGLHDAARVGATSVTGEIWDGGSSVAKNSITKGVAGYAIQ